MNENKLTLEYHLGHFVKKSPEYVYAFFTADNGYNFEKIYFNNFYEWDKEHVRDYYTYFFATNKKDIKKIALKYLNEVIEDFYKELEKYEPDEDIDTSNEAVDFLERIDEELERL